MDGQPIAHDAVVDPDEARTLAAAPHLRPWVLGDTVVVLLLERALLSGDPILPSSVLQLDRLSVGVLLLRGPDRRDLRIDGSIVAHLR